MNKLPRGQDIKIVEGTPEQLPQGNRLTDDSTLLGPWFCSPTA